MSFQNSLFQMYIRRRSAWWETTSVPTLQERRAQLERDVRWIPPTRGVRHEDGEVAGVSGEWSHPDDPRDGVLCYLHGGGYVIGSSRTHRQIPARLARVARLRAFSADYRLAPEHPFPAAVEDAVAVLGALLDEHGPERVVLAGDSAGGGLALVACCYLRDQGRPLPRAIATFSPWTDLAGTGASLVDNRATDPLLKSEWVPALAERYLAGVDPRDPRASPLYAELAGLPPLLVHVSDHEVLRDDAVRLAEKAEAAGVDVTLEVHPGMIHAWHILTPWLPEATTALDSAGEWLAARL